LRVKSPDRTNPVHHLGPVHVGGVNAAKEVAPRDGRASKREYLACATIRRIVRNLRRPQYQSFLEKVKVVRIGFETPRYSGLSEQPLAKEMFPFCIISRSPHPG